MKGRGDMEIVPKRGTPAFEEFARKAMRDPTSIEAKVFRQMMEESQNQVQQNLRSMLDQMIYLAPGRLFRDVSLFHEKFDLKATDDPGHELPEDLLKFRARFLLEELREYLNATGCMVVHLEDSNDVITGVGDFDAEKAFDALIDLCYVALGTAYLHRFPFDEGWARVQEANMAKVRAEGADDARSTRGHSADVVKPEGWRPASLGDLL